MIRTYSTKLSRHECTAVAVSVLAQAGYSVTTCVEPAATVVHGECSWTWHVLLFQKPRPAEIEVTITEARRGSRLEFRTRLSLKCVSEIAVVALLLLIGMSAYCEAALGASGPSSMLAHWKPIVLVALIIAWYLCGTQLIVGADDYGHSVSRAMRDSVRAACGVCEQHPRPRIQPNQWCAAGFALATLAVFAVSVVGRGNPSLSGWLFAAVIVLVAVPLVCVSGFAQRKGGLSERASPALPVLWMLGALHSILIGAVWVVYIVPAVDVATLAPRMPFASFAIYAFAWCYGCLVLRACLRSASDAVQEDLDNQASRSERRNRLAARASFRVAMSSMLLTSGLVLGLSLVIHTAVLAVMLCAWLVGGWPGVHVEKFVVLLAHDVGAGWAATLCVAVIWTTCTLPAIVLWFASIAQLVLSNARRRRRLKRGESTNAEFLRVHAAMQRLAAQVGMPTPMLAITPAGSGLFSADALSLVPRRAAVFVDQRVVGALDPVHIDALLAHELAHVRNGDVWRHAWRRRLFRLIPLGDSFATIMEDAYQYELRADASAVHDFKIPSEVMATALEVWADVQRLTRSGTVVEAYGLPSLAPEDGPSGTAPNAGWREGLRSWWRLFASDTGHGYWHPRIAERAAALRAEQATEGRRSEERKSS